MYLCAVNLTCFTKGITRNSVLDRANTERDLNKMKSHRLQIFLLNLGLKIGGLGMLAVLAELYPHLCCSCR